MKLALVLVAGCGGAATPAPAPAEVDNEGALTGQIAVYAWDGERLAGLYCYVDGALRTERCRFRERFDADALLVIDSDDGESIWTGRSEDAPTLGEDSSGVARLAIPTLVPAVRPKVKQPDAVPQYMVPGYHVLPLAAIDLDRDGVAEVIYLSDDDLGIFVEVDELGLDGGFETRSPWYDESEL